MKKLNRKSESRSQDHDVEPMIVDHVPDFKAVILIGIFFLMVTIIFPVKQLRLELQLEPYYRPHCHACVIPTDVGSLNPYFNADNYDTIKDG